MDIVKRVKKSLEERFPGAAIKVDSSPYSEKVSGYLVWDGFDGMEQIDRQERVIEWLDQRLGAEAKLISVILTYSTNEYQAMSLA